MSSTVQLDTEHFPGIIDLIDYMSGDRVIIERLVDSVHLGDVTIPGFRFGNSIHLSRQITGIMGIQPDKGNLIDQLAMRGAIASRAFALYLSGCSAINGFIVFGGIDTMKYTGTLFSNAMNDVGLLSKLDGIEFTKAGSTSVPLLERSYDVRVDTGANSCHLPKSSVDAIVQQIGPVQWINSHVQIPCHYLEESTTTIDFTFGSTTLRIPLHKFVHQTPSETTPGCFLLTEPLDDEIDCLILGDSLLESVYVVFDQDKGKMWLAESANCGTNPIKVDTETDLGTIPGDCSPNTKIVA